jgi:hypothetical protein
MSQAQQLQKDLEAYLCAHSAFDYVLTIRQAADDDAGDALLEDRVENALKGQLPKGGKFGLCCIIGFPRARVAASDAAGPVEDLDIIVQVVEHIGNNMTPSIGSGTRSDDLADTIKRLLHLHSHDGIHALYVTGSTADEDLPAHLRGQLITLESKAHALTPLSKVARPVITIADPSMTITCATADAAIYYTTDGSFPSAFNDDAELYDGTVDISGLANGTRIRAAAYKSPLRGSDVALDEV